jgi:hypothetical protein
MHSSFLVSVDVLRFHTVEAYTSLGLVSVSYHITKESRAEKDTNIFSGLGENIMYLLEKM